MIDLLTVMAEQVNGALRPATMTFLRVGAAIALVPGFGEQSIPARIRLALALAFTVLIAPVVADHHAGGPVILPALAEVFHVEPLHVPGLDAERCVVWMRPPKKAA